MGFFFAFGRPASRSGLVSIAAEGRPSPQPDAAGRAAGVA